MGESVEDEGDMFLLSNSECIELGQMLNPGSGKIEMYKEYWTSVPFEAFSNGQDEGTTKLSEKPRCLVARTVEGQQAKGLVILLGGYWQGVLRESEHFACTRVRYQPEKDCWEMDPRSSRSESLPVSFLCGLATNVRVGFEFEWRSVNETSTTKWVVTEYVSSG